MSDLYYWEPTKRYGCKMSCPTCGSAQHTKIKDWSNTRTVVGLKRNYFVLSKRYECNKCVPAFRAAKEIAVAAALAANPSWSTERAQQELTSEDIGAESGYFTGFDAASLRCCRTTVRSTCRRS